MGPLLWSHGSRTRHRPVLGLGWAPCKSPRISRPPHPCKSGLELPGAGRPLRASQTSPGLQQPSTQGGVQAHGVRCCGASAPLLLLLVMGWGFPSAFHPPGQGPLLF